MKSIIYKNRVIFAILLCLLTLLLGVYLQTQTHYGFLSISLIMLVNIINRKIFGNEDDLGNKEKMFLLFSVLIIAGVFLFINYNMAVNKIINK